MALKYAHIAFDSGDDNHFSFICEECFSGCEELKLDHASDHFCGEFFGVFVDFFECSRHVECGFRYVITFSVDDGGETLDGIFETDKTSRDAGEDFCDEEGLREESLNFPSPSDGEFVFI